MVSLHIFFCSSETNGLSNVSVIITQVVDSELDLEYKKHDLLRAVQETQRGLTATSDQRSVIEEALVQSLCEDMVSV